MMRFKVDLYLLLGALTTSLVDAQAGSAVRPGPLRQWSISTQPTFTTESRSVKDTVILFDVIGATVLANGTVVVGDNGAQNVKWFAANGTHLRSFGRDGDGPGEFRLVNLIGTCGSDSVFVLDGANRRLSMLSLDGKFYGMRALYTDAVDKRAPSAIKCGGNRRFALLGQPRGSMPAGDLPFRSEVAVRIQSVDGVQITDAGVVSGSDRQRFGNSAGPRPLGKKSLVAIGSGWLYVGTGDSNLIQVFTLSGKPAAKIQLPFERRPISKREIDEYIKNVARLNLKLSESTVRSMYAPLKYPDFFPTHGELLVDNLNNFWVEEYRLPGQTASRWIVFDAMHQAVAEARLPNDFRLIEVGRDYVLGVWSDEDNVKHVRMYRLIRS